MCLCAYRFQRFDVQVPTEIMKNYGQGKFKSLFQFEHKRQVGEIDFRPNSFIPQRFAVKPILKN